MGKFLVRVGINALAVWLVALWLPGITVVSYGASNDTLATVLSYLLIGLIFGIVNAIVRPIVRVLSLPITILTLGLFTIIINAAMLMLVAWITTATAVRLEVDSFFWTAILAALIISIVSLIAGTITRTRK
ncbi:phage holin family protein [Haematomicrobium sanguinis]|uniref:phage holin family protein n=1 Tax=Haematomicrobium sanguinis TaxID=479106 RepID=UPI00047A3C5A|nr:phage holin family protein [Haematomicrobium sanguinis]